MGLPRQVLSFSMEAVMCHFFVSIFKQQTNNYCISLLLYYCIDQMSLIPCLCVPRADTESTSEHLEALRKLSSDLEDQRATLEDLRDQRQAILPRLSLLDKELVKQQVELHSS